MSRLWSFTVDCPRCGGDLTHLTGSQPTHRANLESKAVAACPGCRDTFIIEVTLRSELSRRSAEQNTGISAGPEPRPIRHGTNAGYQAHRRRNEPPCAQCKAAHALRKKAMASA